MIEQAAHDAYEKMSDTLSAIVGDRDTAYRIIWSSVAEMLIVISDPDKSHVELLSAIMARIDGGTAYDLDIWWPIRALYQRDKNRLEFEKSYSLDDREAIDEAASFEKEYGFGFRTGFVGAFWRRTLKSDDTAQIKTVTEWFRTFTECFFADVSAIIDRFGDTLLFKGDEALKASSLAKRSAYVNTIRQVPNAAKLAPPPDLPSAPKKSFGDFLKQREMEE